MTPIVTPFKENEEIAWDLLEQHVDRLIGKGVHCLSPCGSTGEFESMSFDEVIEVYKVVVNKAAGRVPVLGGLGGRSTREAIQMVRAGEKAGLDAALVLPPYYYGFDDEEIYQYYKDIAEATNIIIMLYNNPGKTKVDVTPPLVARLSKIPNIRYIKESSADQRRIRDIIDLTNGEIVVIGGWDSLEGEALLTGALGVVSGGSNCVPEIPVRLWELTEAEKWAELVVYYREVRPILALLEDEGRLAAWIKAGAALRGWDCGVPRRPYFPATTEEIDRIRKMMNQVGIKTVK